jgi:hypothetical protein
VNTAHCETAATVRLAVYKKYMTAGCSKRPPRQGARNTRMKAKI